MHGKQKDLFPEDVLRIPYPGLQFPIDCVPAVEALFLQEASIGVKSNTTCPYRVGDTDPVLRLVCECPATYSLVKALGRKLPPCSRNRCPVRVVLALTDV